ncbi:PREDICTED: tektin-1 [Dinoponera quadriceps]|uniref:Tektin n=1 Tax=Dinoponera quadriceps TaxID=609295 RepID=A0A6P3YFW3_DINQU|nr:PREDICTED: tektin-1 [Dinoponera quadriceps]
MCESVAGIVKSNKEETDHQLKEKLNDIEFRREELLRIRKDVVSEIDGLSIYRQRIMKTQMSVGRNSLAICQKCLNARERRLNIDLVRDDVERELLKEREMIKEAENLLGRVVGEICEKIRKLKATLYHIDNDQENKECNLQIDRRNVALKNTDFNLNTCQSILYPNKPVTIDEWEQQTNNNVIEANKEVNSSKQLRSYIDTIIKQTIDGLNEQKDATNKAFTHRNEQTQEAKKKLELRHSEVLKQIAAMTDNIAQIKNSISDKEGYIALVKERLGSRCQRPEAEVTRDLTEANLVKELYVLRNIVANLQQMLCEVRM